jgi:hypothetical protein
MNIKLFFFKLSNIFLFSLLRMFKKILIGGLNYGIEVEQLNTLQSCCLPENINIK